MDLPESRGELRAQPPPARGRTPTPAQPPRGRPPSRRETARNSSSSTASSLRRRGRASPTRDGESPWTGRNTTSGREWKRAADAGASATHPPATAPSHSSGRLVTAPIRTGCPASRSSAPSQCSLQVPVSASAATNGSSRSSLEVHRLPGRQRVPGRQQHATLLGEQLPHRVALLTGERQTHHCGIHLPPGQARARVRPVELPQFHPPLRPCATKLRDDLGDGPHRARVQEAQAQYPRRPAGRPHRLVPSVQQCGHPGGELTAGFGQRHPRA